MEEGGSALWQGRRPGEKTACSCKQADQIVRKIWKIKICVANPHGFRLKTVVGLVG